MRSTAAIEAEFIGSMITQMKNDKPEQENETEAEKEE